VAYVELPHPRDQLKVAPVAAAKQNHTRACRLGNGKQPWTVEIGGDDDAIVPHRVRQDFGI